MSEGSDWLASLAQRLKAEIADGAAQHPEKITVREFVNRFGFERRGSWIVDHIQNLLDHHELETVPNFSTVWIDAEISIGLDSTKYSEAPVTELTDATQRISSLPSANLNVREGTKLWTVPPTKPLQTATTIMQLNDFSQLPVMPGGNNRDVKGIISWKSIAARMVLNAKCDLVQDCMEKDVQILPISTPLVEAFSAVKKHECILVKREDSTISGIVTASDLASQFEISAVPFALIGEIEGHLRRLVHGKFDREELRSTATGIEGGKQIDGASDLTLAGYHSLLGKSEHWERLQLNVDKDEFRNHLDRVREIRNNLMHFNPDGLSPAEIDTLYNLARFFEELVRFGAI